MRVEMNTTWVFVALVFPLVGALVVASPFWLMRVGDDMGSIAGAGVVLACAVTFIAREYGEVLAITQRCIASSIGCHFHPEPFVRYSIFGAISIGQVFLLFLMGLSVEERLRATDRRQAAQ
ncbi:MAG: hypothetical protein ABI051_00160 [Vicinamibacterales bacterium]